MLRNRLTRLLKICTGTNSGAGEELLQLEGGLEKLVHFWALVIRHFIKNRCLVRASALAFTTLLALIPLLVVAVGITSSLLKSQGEDQIYQVIDRVVSNLMPPATMVMTNGQVITVVRSPGTNPPANFPPSVTLNLSGTNAEVTANPVAVAAATNAIAGISSTNVPEDARVVTVQKEAARSIHDYIQNAQSAKLGFTGMVFFIFTAIGMLRGVENTFNDIWGVTVQRQWWHQVSSYFTIVALGPVVLIAAGSLAGGQYLHATDHLVAQIPGLGRALLQIGPLVILWLMFAMFYMLIPNTQVKFSAAFFGGFVAGTLWHLNNVFAFLYFSRVVTNSAIYGKLGVLPVFMLGLYFSWVILLFGAQVAYAFQNRAAYLQERIADNVNQRGREFVALRIMTLLGQRFQNGQPPAPIIELSAQLGVPSRLTQRVLRTLADAQLVTQAAGDANAFLPARPLELINAHHILRAMRAGSGKDLLVEDSADLTGIYGDFARIESAERAAAEKISVLAMACHMPPPMTLLQAPGDAADAAASARGLNEKPVAGSATAFQTSSTSFEPEKQTDPVIPISPSIATLETSRAEAPTVAATAVTANRDIAQPEDTEFPL